MHLPIEMPLAVVFYHTFTVERYLIGNRFAERLPDFGFRHLAHASEVVVAVGTAFQIPFAGDAHAVAVDAEGRVLDRVDGLDHAGRGRRVVVGADLVAAPVVHLAVLDSVGPFCEPFMDAPDVDGPLRPAGQFRHVLDESELEPHAGGDAAGHLRDVAGAPLEGDHVEFYRREASLKRGVDVRHHVVVGGTLGDP